MSGQPRSFKCPVCQKPETSILTLDGGGIRGFATLLVLQELMKECGNIERELDTKEGHPISDEDRGTPLPCHYFEYVAGTSTGGLIALMIGRLRMSVRDTLSAYEDLGSSVFSKAFRLGPLQIDRRFRFDWRSSKYNEENLKSAITDIVQRHCKDHVSPGDGNDVLLDSPRHGDLSEETSDRDCRTILYALRKNDGGQVPHLFRSYRHNWSHGYNPPERRLKHRNANDESNPLIWQAGRASSAAPTFFKTIKIDGHTYMDGGLDVNNPTWEARNEVHGMHEAECTAQCVTMTTATNWRHEHKECTSDTGGIGVIVSLGTGGRDPLSVFTKGGWLRQVQKLIAYSLDDMTDTTQAHEHTRDRCRGNGTSYFRFNVEDGLHKISMDDASKIDHIRRTVSNFFANRTGNTDIRQFRADLYRCAGELVAKRRSRCAMCHGRRFRRLTRPGPLDALHQQQMDVEHDILNGASRSNLQLHIPPNTHEVSSVQIPVSPHLNGTPRSPHAGHEGGNAGSRNGTLIRIPLELHSSSASPSSPSFERIWPSTRYELPSVDHQMSEIGT